MNGIASPPGLPRDCVAAWYWDEIQRDASDHDHYDDIVPGSTCRRMQDLILGAIEAGVIGHRIPVRGFADPQPLHALIAPYRRHPKRERRPTALPDYRDEWDYLLDDHPAIPFEPGEFLSDRPVRGR